MTKVERPSSTPRTSNEAETLMATLSQRLREAFDERRALRRTAAEMTAAYHQALSIAIIEGLSKPDRAPLEDIEKEIRDLEEHLLGLTLAIRTVDATRRDLKRTELAAERDGLKGALASLEGQIKAKEDECKALRERERGLCWTIRQLQDQIDAPVRNFSPKEIKTVEELEALAVDLTFKLGHELMPLLEEFEGTLAQGTVLRVSEKRVNGRLGVEAVPV
jgi:chromosome segregation ATPase